MIILPENASLSGVPKRCTNASHAMLSVIYGCAWCDSFSVRW